MTNTPPDGLDALAAHVATRLAAAVPDRRSPWRTPVLATARDDGTPSVRTVVLRSVAMPQRHLQIYTDRRSDKVAQIAAQPAVELCFWDPDAREQLRIAGCATASVSGVEVGSAWDALPEASRPMYRAAEAPGTSIAAPDVPAIGGDGRTAFAVLTVVWERWDWLWLGTETHRRARFHWGADGACRISRVVP